MDEAARSPGPCPNCTEPLPEPRPRFCPACGQETTVRPPTAGEFLQQLGGAYLSTEGALWRTLKLLLIHPGELTRQYLTGRRKHYVLPLRLYLTISVVVLLLARVFGAGEPVQVGVAPAGGAQNRTLAMTLGDGRAGLRDGVFYCEDLPGWICRRLQRRIDVAPQEVARQVEQMKERFLSHLGSAMFVLLPCFALWLKLAYLNRRMHYTEHLVFALHVHAFWFFAFAFTLADQTWLTVTALAVVPWYTLRAMRRVYGGRAGPRLLRAAGVSVMYLVTLGFVLAGLGLWTVLA